MPRDRAVDTGSPGQSPRRFLDFEVNGTSLYDALRGYGFDHIGAIWLEPDVEVEADATVAKLLGQAPPDLPPDRVAVYVCPECGDLGCGAITVRVDLGRDEIRWHDWAWQTDYDPEPDRSELAEMPPLSFDRATYEERLRSYRA